MSYLLVLTSIAMLVLYVDHIGRSLRVSSLIELVGTDTRRLLDEQFPDLLDDDKADGTESIAAPKSGVLVSIDRHRLVELAAAADCVVHVVPAIGTFVPSGSPLLRIEGDIGRFDRDAAIAALRVGVGANPRRGRRLRVQDARRHGRASVVRFTVPRSDHRGAGTRSSARRSASTGATPVPRRSLPRRRVAQLRLTVPVMDWDAYVHLAFDEIRIAGSRSPQVTRRLMAAFDDLLEIAPPERRPAIEEQSKLLRAGLRADTDDGADRTFAMIPDIQGIGVAAGNGDFTVTSRTPR